MGKKLSIALFIALLLVGMVSCKKGSSAAETTPKDEPQQPVAERIDPEQEIETQEQPLAKYEYSWGLGDEMPDVVIIIDDFGNSAGKLLDDFAELPAEIVFAVIPDLAHSKTAAEKGAAKGHEIILHIPMEAENSNVSPGERYISKDMPEEEIAPLLDSFLAQMPMAIGANNHMGSATTANLATMNAVLAHFKKKGILFVDSMTTAKTAAHVAALEQGVPYARRDVFLDVPDNSDATLAQKIRDLGKYKGRHEPVIIITHCHNREKLDALYKFMAQIRAMGINIVSLTDAFRSLPV